MFPFLLSSFLGAFLLFQVQPIAGRILTPHFGGSVSVWITCLLFFQWALLAGYGWAHWIATQDSIQSARKRHALLLGLSLLPLPLGLWLSYFQLNASYHPIPQIFIALLLGIGLPYIALASTAPLMQAWFHRVYPNAQPWRLYALSNFGSLLALISYPIFVEPHFGLKTQGWGWSILFLAWVGSVTWCLKRLQSAPPLELSEPLSNTDEKIQREQILFWILFPACGTALLMGATNLIGTDIAAVPFLWVLPLALYLITFMIVFERPHWYHRGLIWTLLGISLFFLIVVLNLETNELSFFKNITFDFLIKPLFHLTHSLNPHLSPSTFSQFFKSAPLNISIILAVMFLGCLVAHGELVRTMPPPRFLTRFYMTMALGGAIGGMMIALLAPLLLKNMGEFYIALSFLMLLAIFVTYRKGEFKDRPLPLLFSGALSLLLISGLPLFSNGLSSDKQLLHIQRTFYGVLKVSQKYQEDQLVRILSHGVIDHGYEYQNPTLSRLPTAYFSSKTGIGLTFSSLRARKPGQPLKVGILGLGVGTIAAYGREGDSFHFYEIDPGILSIAQNWFQFLSKTEAKTQIILGDARLSLEKARKESKNEEFDLLVIDTFSGDSIPVHMLTQEAIQLYFSQLKPEGLLALHIPNKYLLIDKVARGLMRAENLFWREHRTERDYKSGSENTHWVICSREDYFSQDPLFEKIKAPEEMSSTVLWTDDRVDLWTILKWD